MKNFHKSGKNKLHVEYLEKRRVNSFLVIESGKISRCYNQDFVANASAPTIDTLHKSTVKDGSLASLPSCPEEREAVFQRFLLLSILTPYKQKGVVSLSAHGKTIRTRALASPN